MLYLAQFEYIEPGPTYSPKQVINLVENTIVPSLDLVVRYEQEGKVKAAGVVAGSKGSAMILDVKDHSELSSVLQSLPFWSVMRVTVTALQPFGERLEQEKGAVQFLKSPAAEALQNAW
jgi:muconolactone delta-isomerase